MQALISKYGLAAHLALLAVTPLILSPFFGDGAVAASLLWMSLAGALWIIMEPSRKSDEMLHDARSRVGAAILKDPLFWTFVAVAAIAGTSALNGGVERTYDPTLCKWVVTDSPCIFLPGSASGSGFLLFASVVALGVAVEGCRISLGKSARIAFAAVYSIAASFAGIAAAAAKLSGGGEDVLSPGIAFGFAFLSSIVASAGVFECKWHRWLLLYSFAMGGSALGLFLFASPLVLLSFSILGLLVLIGSIVYVGIFQGGAEVAKFLVIVVVASLFPVLASIFMIDPETVKSHVQVYLALDEFPANLFTDGFWERRAALSGFASGFWRDSMWIGGGEGTFPLRLWVAGGAAQGLSRPAPLNGWWKLLCERGILGALALAVPFAIMLYSLVRRAYVAIRFGRIAFFPLVALGVVAAAALFSLALVDPSAMRPDATIAAFAFFALAASSLPLPRLGRNAEIEDGK